MKKKKKQTWGETHNCQDCGLFFSMIYPCPSWVPFYGYFPVIVKFIDYPYTCFSFPWSHSLCLKVLSFPLVVVWSTLLLHCLLHTLHLSLKPSCLNLPLLSLAWDVTIIVHNVTPSKFSATKRYFISRGNCCNDGISSHSSLTYSFHSRWHFTL